MTTDPGARPTLLVDADDTLWENNIYFIEVTERFLDEAERHGIDRTRAHSVLQQTERRNVPIHGYGSHSYAQSLGDAFRELLPESSGETAQELVALGRAIHERTDLELLPGVRETLHELSEHATLILVTKGRPEEQLLKLERSGLGPYFEHVEVVPEKTAATYLDIVQRHGLDPARTWMIGNSPRSDINPALEAGLNAILVPHPHTWELEVEDVQEYHERLVVADQFGQLVALFSPRSSER